jgi:DedD protein
MDSVNVRNLEQIEEHDQRGSRSRLGTLLLASLGGAALVIVGVMSTHRSGPPARSTRDPLAALVAEAKSAHVRPADELSGNNVTFPGILSDDGQPTTALAAVKDAHGRLIADPSAAPAAPPPPTDKLPVVPLPAGTLLDRTKVTTDPKDKLTELADDASRVSSKTALAPEGSQGGYQIQVASFKKQSDADAFVQELRERGHPAYREAAYVAGRGMWHRVRIGPFKSKFAADRYAEKLRDDERLSTFVIDPHKQKLEQEIYDAKVAARIRKYGRP